MSRFEGRTVIIAGGGGAIGRASAIRLAAEGARVVCLDIAETREESARLASEIGSAAGGSGHPLALDAGDPENVKAIFAEAISRFGPVEALVNSIGFGSSAKALEVGEERRAHIEAATPLRRIATAEDVAGVVACIASGDARHITGTTVDVNGGLFLA